MEQLFSSPEDYITISGCVFMLDDGQNRRFCGAAQRRGSSYCPQHHTLCHVACGTAAEAQRLREVEALARAVGGRRARGAGPSRRFINRLEQAVRVFP
jgi:hypothetical protein